MFGRKRLAVLGAAGIGAALAGAGVAYSAIPGSDHTIHGCYGRLTGNLRVIDAEAGRACSFLEIPISWNAGGGGGLTHVTSADIDDGEVMTVDIRDGAVTPDKLSQTYASAADLANEASARTSADTSEASARGSADTALQNAISSLTTDLQDFKTGLATSDGTVNQSSDPIDFTKLKGVSVTGGLIANGAVTTGNIANGAVTTSKQTANAPSSTEPSSAPLLAGQPWTQVLGTILTTPASETHRVLVTGQAQITCTSCALDTEIAVTWQLYRDSDALGAIYSGVVQPGNESLILPVSFMDSAPGGTSNYRIHVSTTGPSTNTFTVSGATLSAVDLGQ